MPSDAPTGTLQLPDGERLAVTVETPSPPAAPIGAAAALDAWLDQHVRNSAYSADTGTWNRIYGAVGTIKAAIGAIDARKGS